MCAYSRTNAHLPLQVYGKLCVHARSRASSTNLFVQSAFPILGCNIGLKTRLSSDPFAQGIMGVRIRSQLTFELFDHIIDHTLSSSLLSIEKIVVFTNGKPRLTGKLFLYNLTSFRCCCVGFIKAIPQLVFDWLADLACVCACRSEVRCCYT